MPNHHRGEIGAVLDGRPHTLCLTLGALAELESVFGDENMLALAQRFEGGRLSARDCVRIIGAGLRGAGHDIPDEAVARMQANGGVTGFVDIVARLLTVTFGALPPLPVHSRGEGRDGGTQSAASVAGEGQQQATPSEKPEVPAPAPFPGTR